MSDGLLNVSVLVGSLRRDSLNRRIANTLPALAPKRMGLCIVGIAELPFYNADLEVEAPAPWRALREAIRASDAVLFITPEYNRSVPAVLKNAIDVGSRPYGQSSWNGKPAAIISTSPGALGAFGANHHLRQSLVSLNMPSMQQPEAYIGGVDKLFDEEGVIAHGTAEFLQRYLLAFERWIIANRQA